MSAGGSTGGSDHVWIKLATAKEDVFAKIYYSPGKDVSDVAALACKEFPRWRLDAGQVRLHPVTVSGKEPSEEEIGAAWATKPLAVSEGVTSGAWLVAVPNTPGSSGGGGGGSSRGDFDFASAFASLEAKISSADAKISSADAKISSAVVQQVQTEDFIFSAAPTSAVNKLMAARHIKEHNLALPPIAHLMPPPRSLVPFSWGVMRETTASPSLLKLLERWVKTGTASPPENVFRDVQSLAAHSPLEVREPGIGRFKGVPDLAILCHGCEAGTIIPLSNCAAAVDWKTTPALSGGVTAQALLQSLGLCEISGGGASSPPVFFTDLASHFLCCRMVREDMHYYVGVAGKNLSLEEGVGLLRHFLLLDKERELAYLAGLQSTAVGEGANAFAHLGGERAAERGAMSGGGGGGGSSTANGPRECVENWDPNCCADSFGSHCGREGSTSVADAQALHIAELQSITIALTHQLTAHGGICRKDFCVQEED